MAVRFTWIIVLMFTYQLLSSVFRSNEQLVSRKKKKEKRYTVRNEYNKVCF